MTSLVDFKNYLPNDTHLYMIKRSTNSVIYIYKNTHDNNVIHVILSKYHTICDIFDNKGILISHKVHSLVK